MSARQITKEAANKVANLLVEKKRNELTRLEKELSGFYTKVVTDQIPPEVMLLWENPIAKAYISGARHFCIKGRGIENWFQVSLRKNLPYDGKSVEVSGENADEIVKMRNEIKALNSEIGDLVSKFETAIYNLRSYARIEKEFPEAYVLIPREEGVNLPSINLGEIRELAKNIQ